MKWTKEYAGSSSRPIIVYTNGAYRISRTQSKNIWTGRVMSEQVWNIYKGGKEIDWAPTLREAKALVENKEVQG